MTSVRERILSAAHAQAEAIRDLSRRIHQHPELSRAELQGSRWCAELLAAHGFAVEWVPGVEHAFVATRACGRPGPTVGFLAEYDALPGIGHGCGHNLIAGSAVGAGLALGAAVAELGGAVKVYGCPGEEVGYGKPAMLAAGAFAGLGAALTFHAWSRTAVMTASTGIRTYDLQFQGRPAHAATDPWQGASALDGVLLTWNNLNALRQFVRDGVRIHGVITHGGDAFNVIPARASCRVAVRSSSPAELDRVITRVLACAAAGALASGTELTHALLMEMLPVRHEPALAGRLQEHLAALGESPGEPWVAPASTDFGNVSQVLPAVLFSVATWPESVAFHTPEAAEHAGGARAEKAMLTAVRAMALTGADLLADAAFLRRVEISFAAG